VSPRAIGQLGIDSPTVPEIDFSDSIELESPVFVDRR